MNVRMIMNASIGMLVLAASMATAQTHMERAVVADGGGRTASPATVLESTTGQPVADRSSSATTIGQFGFWHTALVPAGVPLQWNSAGAIASLKVAPNPLSGQGQIQIVLAARGQVDVVLYDEVGRAIAPLFSGVRESGTFVISMDAASLAAGTYYIAVGTTGALVQHPVTIVH